MPPVVDGFWIGLRKCAVLRSHEYVSVASRFGERKAKSSQRLPIMAIWYIKDWSWEYFYSAQSWRKVIHFFPSSKQSALQMIILFSRHTRNIILWVGMGEIQACGIYFEIFAG